MTIINEKQKAINAIVGCEYVFSKEIGNESAAGSGKVSITLLSGKSWKPIYFTPGSALLTSKETNPFEGKIIENTFEMKVPGGSSDLTSELEFITGRSIVLKLTFENGDILICGGRTRKLRLLALTSAGISSVNTLSFNYKSRKKFAWMV